MEPTDAADLITEIRRDIWLNEEQKKTLVQIYESFRAERRAAGFEPELDGQGAFTDDAGGDLGAQGAQAPAAPGPDADLGDAESEALAGR